MKCTVKSLKQGWNTCGACSALLNQRGALFGMDARIALGIFAALAAMMGYFGFGKMQSARHGSLIKELQQIEDAVKGYETDMGSAFHQFTIQTSNGANDFAALYNVSLLKTGYQGNWNGPYYSIENTNHAFYGAYAIGYGQDDRVTACAVNTECYVWLQLTDVPASIWQAVNAYIDENNGTAPEGSPIDSGRIMASAATDPRILYFRVTKRKR